MKFNCNTKLPFEPKYRILEKLQAKCSDHPESEREKVMRREMRLLTAALEVSGTAFQQWLEIPKANDHGQLTEREIPLSKLEILADYFGCEISELKNFKPKKVDFQALRSALRIA